MSKSVSSKTALGHAFGTVIVAGIVSATGGPANAAPFTPEQCKIIASAISEVLGAVGPDTLSVEFRTSLRNFVVTDGNLTCEGSRDILTPTTKDIAAFNTIRTILLGGPHPISLQDAGVRSIAAR
jgi:hypothetical protein